MRSSNIHLISSIIIAFIYVFVISGCCNNNEDIYTSIPNENKLRYDEGDTLIYQSSYGIYDTMIVFKKIKTNDYIEMYDYCGTKRYHEIIEYYLKSIFTNDTNWIHIEFKDEYRIRWNNFYFSNVRGDQFIYYDELTISNIKYYRIIEMFTNNSEKTKMFYHPIEGCIRFEFNPDSTWTLIP